MSDEQDPPDGWLYRPNPAGWKQDMEPARIASMGPKQDNEYWIATEPLYLRSQSTELARLRAENERLRADAARFRWLVDTADPSWTVQMFENYETGEVRDVIDAAMAQGKV